MKGILLAFATCLFPESTKFRSPVFFHVLSLWLGTKLRGFLQDNICLLQSIKHFYGKAACVGRSRGMTKHDMVV